MTPHVTQSILSSNIYAEKKHRQLYQEDSNWEWSNWNLRKWHLQLFSVYWNRNQVSHYPSPLLGIKKGCGGVRVGEREWGSLQNYLDSGPERALGKSHTKAFSLAVASRNPKSISPPRSEAPFPSFVLYLWSRLVILFCGPCRGWHSFSSNSQCFLMNMQPHLQFLMHSSCLASGCLAQLQPPRSIVDLYFLQVLKWKQQVLLFCLLNVKVHCILDELLETAPPSSTLTCLPSRDPTLWWGNNCALLDWLCSSPEWTRNWPPRRPLQICCVLLIHPKVWPVLFLAEVKFSLRQDSSLSTILFKPAMSMVR